MNVAFDAMAWCRRFAVGALIVGGVTASLGNATP